MKKLNILYAALLTVVMAGCSTDDMMDTKSGYLKINITTKSETREWTSRAIPAEYNASQLAIEIVDQTGAVVKQTDDASIWAGQPVSLKAGEYTVNVHSNNWDGNDSGRDVPFYSGSKTVTVVTSEKTEADIVCTLANVKVSVDFDESVSAKFASAYVDVTSAVTGIEKQTFTMGVASSLVSAYFPVGDLTATLHITNKAGKEYTQATQLTGVKARDHYKLHYSVEASGEGGFTVTASDAETTYTYTLYVPGDPVVAFNTSSKINEWATFAYAEGTITSTSIDPLDDAKVMMQYKADNQEEWTSVATTKTGDTYKATLKGLQAETAYSCRLAYVDGTNELTGTAVDFTTEAAAQMPNSGFEDWCTVSRLNYACKQEDQSSNLFWGSSNVNAVITQINGVSGTTDCHSGSKAASLQSKYVNVIGIRKFAAGSLFTGTMPTVKGTNGASIDFGRPFTSRPSQLKGYYKYSGGIINQMGSYALPDGANVVKGQTPDLWSAWVVLMTEIYTLDNSTEANLQASLRDFTAGTDPAVIAYGEVPVSKCVEASDWTEFTVDLHYFDTVTKPSYIIVVMSSSKYGDYFTGYDNSLLKVDDIQLVYDEPAQ